MALVSVENLGSVGLIVDVPDYELPPEGVSAGENVRFFEGKILKIPGHETVFGTPNHAAQWLLPWKTATEDRWIYAGTTEVSYTYNSIHTNITRFTTTLGDDDYQANTRPIWSGGILHGVPILNHDASVDYPQQWNDTSQRLEDLSNWPVNTTCKIIRPFQNFLVALDITKSSTRYPYTVKWSHPADPGTVPTSWDENDSTKLAGEQTIAQSGGFLVDCFPLASRNILYKTDSIWSMTPNGGASVFSFHELSSTIGALAPRCIKEFFRQHFIVGQNDIVLFDGSNTKSVVNRRVRKWFFNSLHADHWDKTIVTIHYAQREVWISFVEAGATSEYLTRALIWNWDTNTFSTRELPDIAHIAFGVVSTGVVETFNNTSAANIDFDLDAGQFNESGVNPAALQLLFGKAYDTPELLHGDTTYAFNASSYTSYVERLGLALAGTDRHGNPKVDPYSVKFVRSFIPKITAISETTVQISVGMQDVPGGAVTWDGPHDFTIGVDTKVDVGISGKYVAWKVEDSGSVPWEMTGFTLDMDIISRL